MNDEQNTCAFCRNTTVVNRQYLHAKNKPLVGDGFDFVYYCNDCGLLEIIKTPTVLTKEDLAKQKKLQAEYRGCNICPENKECQRSEQHLTTPYQNVATPCSCPKGGIFSDDTICEKCDGYEWLEKIDPDTNDPSQFPADGNDMLNY